MEAVKNTLKETFETSFNVKKVKVINYDELVIVLDNVAVTKENNDKVLEVMDKFNKENGYSFDNYSFENETFILWLTPKKLNSSSTYEEKVKYFTIKYNHKVSDKIRRNLSLDEYLSKNI